MNQSQQIPTPMVLDGLKARTFYAWMFIDWLWVSEPVRGAGFGSSIMDKAEANRA